MLDRKHTTFTPFKVKGLHARPPSFDLKLRPKDPGVGFPPSPATVPDSTEPFNRPLGTTFHVEDQGRSRRSLCLRPLLFLGVKQFEWVSYLLYWFLSFGEAVPIEEFVSTSSV